LVYLDINEKWNIVQTKGSISGNELRIEVPYKLKPSGKFMLLEEGCHFITCNYYYELRDSSSIMCTKNEQGLIGRQKYLYLSSKK
jgi:hypothetical protein